MFKFNETCTQELSIITNHMTRNTGHKVQVKGNFTSVDDIITKIIINIIHIIFIVIDLINIVIFCCSYYLENQRLPLSFIQFINTFHIVTGASLDPGVKAAPKSHCYPGHFNTKNQHQPSQRHLPSPWKPMMLPAMASPREKAWRKLRCQTLIFLKCFRNDAARAVRIPGDSRDFFGLYS